jgi:hypothetical protein
MGFNMKEKKSTISLDDLNSVISFDGWIRDNLSYPNKKRVPLNHLERYLGYIESKLKEEVGSNKDEWIEKISSLLKRIEEMRA